MEGCVLIAEINIQFAGKYFVYHEDRFLYWELKIILSWIGQVDDVSLLVEKLGKSCTLEF